MDEAPPRRWNVSHRREPRPKVCTQVRVPMPNVSSVCFSFEVEDANLLARKQYSVNTYRAIDTASRAMTNIQGWLKQDFLLSPTKVYLS